MPENVVPDEGLDPVAMTGRLTAAMRAKESARPDRLFDDPLAARLAGTTGQTLLEEFVDTSHTIAVRTRFYDDALTAILDDGPDQLVILAAGMDSRAYRLAFPTGTAVYELDRPEVLRLKDHLLTEPPDPGPTPRCDRRPVGVDLTADWVTPLAQAGFTAERPTCWLVEGLTPYLPEPAVHDLLARVTAVSAPGSQLLIDILGRWMLDSPVLRPMLDWFAARDMTWLFGTDQPEDLLTAHGWRPEVTEIGTVGQRLNRWPYPAIPRGTPNLPRGYFVRARR